MLVVVVDIQVKPDSVSAFKAATIENASRSLEEEGILRFDVLSDRDDPTHFQLIEIYKSEEAPAAHKQTAHYKTWRDAVEPMMARPRSSTKFENVFPLDENM